MPYSPGGYSWLAVAPEPKENKSVPKETTVAQLERKIHTYHTLSKKYEKFAGTRRAVGIAREMNELKKEIELLSKNLGKK